MLTLGSVPYLNALPLYRTLETSGNAQILRVVPARLGRHLASGECAAALLPVVDHFRDPHSFLISDACIGSDGAVRSVLLFSKKAPREIGSVAADTSSHTSVALLRVLLADVFNVRPPFIDHAPDINQMLKQHDAALIIGDNALEAVQNPPQGVEILDLGAQWKQLTGLPFVFAAWIAKKQTENLGEILSHARDEGEANLKQIVEENPIPTRLSQEKIEDYLRHAVTFHLDENHRAGLEEFRVRCQKHNLIPCK
ncbi:MAG TPA: menaquinone biosynthesis protein [Abditibacteriaceae bacterium]|jgi:chorismate dehydratase